MAVKAELLGGAPGCARIRLHGITGQIAGVMVQIRRNQGTEVFLGLDGQWQASPDCWHKIDAGAVGKAGDSVDIAIGSMIVDSVVRAQAGNAFMVSWRVGEKVSSATLVLSSQHPLLASDARRPPSTSSLDRPIVEPPSVQKPADEVVIPPDLPLTAGERMAAAEAPPKGRAVLLTSGLVALLLAASVGGYYWYRFNGTAPPDASPTSAPGNHTTREMLATFMDANPEAAAIVGKADEMMQAGNSEAAVYLYRQGADRGDARSALQLGLLYAPDGPVVADSTFTKSSDTAAFWYSKAAEAGLAEAQRRLGNILTKLHPAGTGEFDAGVAWLKAASKQGDADAAARLKELGQ